MNTRISYSFRQSVTCALDGLVRTARQERHFRWELTIAAILVPIVLLLPFSTMERVGFWALTAAVLTIELLNTAIERAVDLRTREIHPDAGAAKDAAAAAVFLVIVVAFIYGVVMIGRLFARRDLLFL